MHEQIAGTGSSTSTYSSPSKDHLPDPSLPAPPLQDDEKGFTADQLIARQAALEQEAREAVPFSFTSCSYERGYIRQPVFACKTCGGGGVCAGCSVGCHADHELVELFAKRNFRCDCGTLSLCRGEKDKQAMLAPCSLRTKELSYAPQNDENRYNKNFEGVFCRCERGKMYDAEKEEETMLQCLCCEDWIHESCSTLRPSKAIDDFDNNKRILADGPLVDHDSFDLFICHECMQLPANKILRPYIGARGWIVCVPEQEGRILPDAIDGIKAVNVTARGEGWEHPWKVFGMEKGTVGYEAAGTFVPTAIADGDGAGEATTKKTDKTAATKRPAEDDKESGTLDTVQKRPKIVGGLPVYDDFSDADDEDGKDGQDAPLITAPGAKTYVVGGDVCIEPDVPLFAGEEKAAALRFDVFLADSFRERICLCGSCASDWAHLPFVVKAEETYSPPRSQQGDDEHPDGRSDAGGSQTSSTYDLGLAALNRLPREQMMESLQAYNKMRDALFQHLRPFADSGKVVDADSVREFFRKQKEEQDAARNGDR